jgi:glyoxylase-like metal-dependent hydrolase (beta-lactamase superfamily II)
MRLTEHLALVGCGDARYTDEYDCNVYAVTAPDGPILIDAGGGRDTQQILVNAEHDLDVPVAVLLTHAHADHSQGTPDLQRQSIPVHAPEATGDLLADGTDEELGLEAAKRSGVYPSSYEFKHARPDQTFKPDATVTVAGRTFEVIRFAGHAADHVCYITEIDGETACFSGDAVYPDGSISLLNVSGSSLAAYRRDVGALENRGIDLLLPGHGLPMLADGQSAIDAAAESLREMYSPPSRT